MFTGIIETLGHITDRTQQGENVVFRIQSNISKTLKIDQSLAHDGVCLTVVAQEEDWHEVVAVKETLDRSALGLCTVGATVNLERAMKLDARLDGHLVQGHVDTIATVRLIEDQNGSHLFSFECQSPDFEKLAVDKGSICLNGVSLTLIKPTNRSFQVAIIPYTYEHTNFHNLKIGDQVNIEFDIIGKYVARQLRTIGA